MEIKLRLKYINEFTDRHGRVRRYFRGPGLPAAVKLPADLPLHSEAFLEIYRAELAKLGTPRAIGAERSLPGTVKEAVAAYLASNQFAGLAKATRDMRRRELDRFCRDHGAKPLARLEAVHIARIMEKRKPFAAHNFLKSLRGLFDHAVRTGRVKTDPTAVLKRPKAKAGAIHDWTEEEIAQYRERWALGTVARLTMEVGFNTIQRLSDVWQIGWQHVRRSPEGPTVWVKQQKTGIEVEIPILPELSAALAATKTGDLQWLINEWGIPFASPDTLGNKVRDWCDAAGLPQCSLHGLRKAGARRFAEHGCTVPQIAAFGGWKSLREVQRYIDAADRKKLARQGAAKLVAGTRVEQNLQTGSEKSTNPESK
jgi:integrase